MCRHPFRGFLLVAMLTLSRSVTCLAGQFEDASSAYQKGNFATAARLMHSLAEDGNAKAQSFLGFMYHDGEGVPRDYVQAYMWFYLAASLYPADSEEFKDSMDARDLTGKLMTPAQIEAARTLARKCQASNYNRCE